MCVSGFQHFLVAQQDAFSPQGFTRIVGSRRSRLKRPNWARNWRHTWVLRTTSVSKTNRVCSTSAPIRLYSMTVKSRNCLSMWKTAEPWRELSSHVRIIEHVGQMKLYDMCKMWQHTVTQWACRKTDGKCRNRTNNVRCRDNALKLQSACRTWWQIE